MKNKPFLKKENPGYYLHACAQRSGIVVAFTTRKFNYDLRAASSPEEKEEIRQNRARIFKCLDLDISKAVFPEQVHKSRINRVSLGMLGRGAFDHGQSIRGSDALISAEPSAVLCMLSADCLPVVFHCRSKNILALAHAGWRGLKDGIIFKTARRLKREFSCLPQEFCAYIGPGICVNCYEVDSGMKGFFPDDVRRHKKRFFLDLKKNCFSQLAGAGLPAENIFDSGFCTYCNNKLFFSFRAGDKQNRMLTFAAFDKQDRNRQC